MNEVTAHNPFAPPRAVVEDRPDVASAQVPATRGSRLAAALIDGVAVGGVVAIIGIVAAIAIPAYASYQRRAGGDPTQTGPALVLVGGLAFLAIVGVFAWNATLVYRYGQTIGKRAMGIRVVRTDGTRVAFGRFVFLRWLPMFVLGIIPWIGYVTGLVDSLLIFRDTRQCLHDNIADTIVVTAASAPHATLAGSGAR
ncbi:RDD family protein [Scleromatobacter humisilvae]|uniref:RDD family protein n=1 Tax=Scleromatobacter humisilvae TaxID=2897159 RepID=A0A9X1YNX8_9BURK|nr:RDD family protein [Scleromatobacter humisilvae]MCK9688273.1 RDD family protein [Scleromatobacter humisilvae]